MIVATLLICLTLTHLSTFFGLLLLSGNSSNAITYLSSIKDCCMLVCEYFNQIFQTYIYLLTNELPKWIEQQYFERIMLGLINCFLFFSEGICNLLFSSQSLFGLLVLFFVYEILFDYGKCREIVESIYFPFERMITAVWTLVTDREKLMAIAAIFLILFMRSQEPKPGSQSSDSNTGSDSLNAEKG
jgi:hypothetical protein